jgi:hypothetical protein
MILTSSPRSYFLSISRWCVVMSSEDFERATNRVNSHVIHSVLFTPHEQAVCSDGGVKVGAFERAKESP